MKPSDEQMRDTAYEIIRQLRRECEDCDAEPDDDYVANVIVGVLREAFPEPPAVEGSVRVRIACDWKQRDNGPVGCVNFADADVCHASAISQPTHRGYVEFDLPPVAQVPVVQGTVVKDQA